MALLILIKINQFVSMMIILIIPFLLGQPDLIYSGYSVFRPQCRTTRSMSLAQLSQAIAATRPPTQWERLTAFGSNSSHKTQYSSGGSQAPSRSSGCRLLWQQYATYPSSNIGPSSYSCRSNQCMWTGYLRLLIWSVADLCTTPVRDVQALHHQASV